MCMTNWWVIVFNATFNNMSVISSPLWLIELNILEESVNNVFLRVIVFNQHIFTILASGQLTTNIYLLCKYTV